MLYYVSQCHYHISGSRLILELLDSERPPISLPGRVCLEHFEINKIMTSTSWQQIYTHALYQKPAIEDKTGTVRSSMQQWRGSCVKVKQESEIIYSCLLIADVSTEAVHRIGPAEEHEWGLRNAGPARGETTPTVGGDPSHEHDLEAAGAEWGQRSSQEGALLWGWQRQWGTQRSC